MRKLILRHFMITPTKSCVTKLWVLNPIDSETFHADLGASCFVRVDPLSTKNPWLLAKRNGSSLGATFLSIAQTYQRVKPAVRNRYEAILIAPFNTSHFVWWFYNGTCAAGRFHKAKSPFFVPNLVTDLSQIGHATGEVLWKKRGYLLLLLLEGNFSVQSIQTS